MEDQEIRQALKVMERDKAYVSKSVYTPNETLWPNHQIPFANVHLNYLKSHPLVNPRHYLANLRLMIKKR